MCYARKLAKIKNELLKPQNWSFDNRTIEQSKYDLSGAMQKRWLKASETLLEYKKDILIYKTFPEEHHRSIYSVNPIERLNRKIGWRERVVGVFPDRTSVYRLLGTQLMNIDEGWRAGRHYMAKEWTNKLFEFELDNNTNDDNLLLDEEPINLEAQNIIYTETTSRTEWWILIWIIKNTTMKLSK
jgi:transposase-like protein